MTNTPKNEPPRQGKQKTDNSQRLRAVLSLVCRGTARVLTAITGPWNRRNAFLWLKLILAVLAIRWLWFEPYRIPSDSMYPTLDGDERFFRGDRVLVNKFIYGPRFPLDGFDVPFTNVRLWYAHRRLWRGAEPKRWEIVVFKSTPAEEQHKTLIKRVVGLPGERVHIENGSVYINGERMEPPENLRDILHYTTKLVPDDAAVAQFMVQLSQADTLPSILNIQHENVQKLVADLLRLREEAAGKNLAGLSDAEIEKLVEDADAASLQVVRELLTMISNEQKPLKYGIVETHEFAQIPDDAYFMLGDNSGSSVDGRYFGWVPRHHLLGRTFCIWWPLSRWKDFTGFSDTWWGWSLLHVIPTALVLWALVTSLIITSWRNPKGDHMMVYCLAYGLRIPVLHARLFPKPSKPGERVLYWAPVPRGRGRVLKQGRVLAHIGQEVADDCSNRYAQRAATAYEVAEDGAKGEAGVETVRHRDLVGRIVRVWWPSRRRRPAAGNGGGR